ncbi:rifin PIR protein, putative [Plasmodium reichenowi]|uniref:Rifin PIR protein, putative n=1 Tax=Plasmodium reichenowi TaxID=5854 RepID=A0A2P9DSA6_PLARE|nr:rifin PIR protein, putative [Plasmodium reichenowi]
MNVHYINILLFAIPLNILVHNKNKPNITIHHTQTNRSLCECELYMPNYDNDEEMKKVMQQFEDRTSQRFHEYDDRVVEKRKRCKDQCDKEIQKIILKDKLEKQIAQQLNTLETKIDTDDIPTCICEKSLAEKVEKECLKCAQNLGGIVAPSTGVLGEIAAFAIGAWKNVALDVATKEAVTEATKAATQTGVQAVISQINVWSKSFIGDEGFVNLTPIVNKFNFKCHTALQKSAMDLVSSKTCNFATRGSRPSFCNTIEYGETTMFKPFAEVGRSTFEAELALQKEALEARNIAAVEAATTSYYTPIIASIVAIVVIILVMVIIYLILRYRRKKKMKKKLQYIKLLEE